LVLYLAAGRRVTAGALGSRRLEAGWYVYVGSAKRNLHARLARHLRSDKRAHWHIDGLRRAASIHRIWVRSWGVGVECRVNGLVRLLPGASTPWKGFGSSDCRCTSHLTALSAEPEAFRGPSPRSGWREWQSSPVSAELLASRQRGVTRSVS
jgi:sugar fermentation stimulation protein A